MNISTVKELKRMLELIDDKTLVSIANDEELTIIYGEFEIKFVENVYENKLSIVLVPAKGTQL
jgi:hypothetical protein